MATISIILYDGNLDLTTKNDQKQFQYVCRGLKEADKLGGKKTEYMPFTKLLERGFEDVHIMENLNISTICDIRNPKLVLQKVPTELGTIDIPTLNKATKAKIKDQAGLVWVSTNHVNAANYFLRFATVSTKKYELYELHSQKNLKHIIIGRVIFNNLKSNYQVEIMGSAKECKIGTKYDRSLFWDFIKRKTNTMTSVGVSNKKIRLKREH